VVIAENDFHRKGASADWITIDSGAKDTYILWNRVQSDVMANSTNNGADTFVYDSHNAGKLRISGKVIQYYKEDMTTATHKLDTDNEVYALLGANGQVFDIGQYTTEKTALSGATVTWANAIPAGTMVLGVSARVTTLVEGCTSIDIGDGTDADIFVDGMAVALNTTADLADCNDGTLLPNTYKAATNIVLTAVGDGASFTAGAVRLTVYYIELTPPTS